MNKKVYIRTFGCQMNVHDSEKIMGILEQEGYKQTESPRSADLIIFNTCSIRQKAEQKFFSELGRIKSYKRINRDLKIIVAGCIAQQEGRNIWKRVPFVDVVLGPQNIHILRNLNYSTKNSIFVKENPHIASSDLPVRRESDLRAWVTIMYGCNNFCSYCVVPYTRGRERSRPSKNIYSEVVCLAESGCKEITLLGQNVNSYKGDCDFPALLHKLNNIDGIERIRFITSHPKDLSDDLINSIAELPKICEHIHLPLQTGSDKILELMNRGYTYKEYLQKIQKLRQNVPEIAITTDIISGFPGETDSEHFQTVQALKEIEFDGIFAFNFSPRPNTKAAEMHDSVPTSVKSDRLKEILSIQDTITLKKNKRLKGSLQEILLEGSSEDDSDTLTGRTRTNKIVHIPKNGISKISFMNVQITKAGKHSLVGKPSSE